MIFEESVLSSRFIAILSPLMKGEEFAAIYQGIKKRYPKARHYPYALKALSFEKASDDGEPPRSVGVSLLSLLQKNGLAYASLAVVRYFGGTKLGLGRLCRTYRETAERCLEKAAFAELLPGLEEEILLSYSSFSALQRLAPTLSLDVQALSYGENVRLLLRGDAKIITSLLANAPEVRLLRRKEIFYQRSVSR